MQRARCYLLGESAVVLELEPPITLATQKRIWRLAQRLVDAPNVLEAIPGMNNITVTLRDPKTLALDAIERLQRWWEESEALEPDSRFIEIPVTYGGQFGPDLAEVARHSGLSDKQVVELHASVDYVVWFIGFQPGFPYLGSLPEPLHTGVRSKCASHPAPVRANQPSVSNSTTNCPSVISSAAAFASLPTSRLATFSAGLSSAPQ